MGDAKPAAAFHPPDVFGTAPCVCLPAVQPMWTAQLSPLHAKTVPLLPCCYAGWQASAAGIRRVAPYRAALPPAAPAIQPGALVAQQPARGAVIRTQDLLSFDWSRLGGGFLGVLLQLGDSLPSSRPAALPAAADAAGAAPAAEQAVCAAAAGPQALSWQGLAACLRLGDGVLPCGLVFVWASKASVAPAVRLLGALGCKYVENLTWVQLGAGNRPLLVSESKGHPACSITIVAR